ncbi:MAG: hypothetical protein VKJ05_09260 [Synechococcaceae cyanobacterium]|nr:hypothetical protein [Synechococcaceae cyanobacterium]
MSGLPSLQGHALAQWLAALGPPAPEAPAPAPSPAGPVARAGEEAIVGLITARPWRRSAVDAATVAAITARVRQALRDDAPIEFSLPFGGYRGWRLPSSPNLDWAEVFWIRYLRAYADRLAAVHPAGVRLSLSYVGGVLGWVNLLPQADQGLYLQQLQRLLARFSSASVAFQLVDHSEACGGTAAVLVRLQAALAAQPPADADALARARRNLHWPGEAPPPAAAVEAAARRCAALMALEERRAFNKFGPRIQLSHLRGAALALPIGSCRSAVAQPWVSQGYLQWRPDRQAWLERLATASALPASLQVVPVHHRLLGISPALERLPLRIDDAAPGSPPAACPVPRALSGAAGRTAPDPPA